MNNRLLVFVGGAMVAAIRFSDRPQEAAPAGC